MLRSASTSAQLRPKEVALAIMAEIVAVRRGEKVARFPRGDGKECGTEQVICWDRGRPGRKGAEAGKAN